MCCIHYREDSGDLKDTILVVLQNFSEMVSLWCRITSTNPRVKEIRDKERNNLSVLVGINLVVLSNLDSINDTLYAEVSYIYIYMYVECDAV